MARTELMDYDQALELFEPVIGLEVHVELSTRTKMFSDSPNPAFGDDFGAEPNTQITPLDIGLPGSLPVLNEQAPKYSISFRPALRRPLSESSRCPR